LYARYAAIKDAHMRQTTETRALVVMNPVSREAFMNDFLVQIKETPRGPWPVFDRESESALLRWAEPNLGEWFLVRVLKVMAKRSDRAHRLYRLRNAVLAPALDMDVDSLHDWIKTELDMIEELTVMGKPWTRLRSQKEFSVEEMSAMMLKQDELRDFVNSGKEPQDYLILPTTEMI
jgi:hypothetical protein